MTRPSDTTMERMKVLMQMIEENYEKGIADTSYCSPYRGSLKHLACELGKLCSQIRKEM